MKVRIKSLLVDGLEVELHRKKMKNLRLVVLPPDGRVRVSIPHYVSDRQASTLVRARLGWIKKQQAHVLAQPRMQEIRMVTGEMHDFMGRSYRLEVLQRWGRHEIIINGRDTLCLLVHPGTSRANRLRVLREWYRAELKARIGQFLDHWQPLLGVEVCDFGVKDMKTRWGSCNINKKRIWLSLQLARRPAECLEYVVVHELLHLIEKQHNKRFYALLDRFLPDWPTTQNLLS